MDALQSSRLAKELKRLLDCKYSGFQDRFGALRNKLETSPYSIAKYLKKVLKNNTKLFADKSETIQNLLTPNQVNNNTIKSTFGR